LESTSIPVSARTVLQPVVRTAQPISGRGDPLWIQYRVGEPSPRLRPVSITFAGRRLLTAVAVAVVLVAGVVTAVQQSPAGGHTFQAAESPDPGH
jgi:hypothetical protein